MTKFVSADGDVHGSVKIKMKTLMLQQYTLSVRIIVGILWERNSVLYSISGGPKFFFLHILLTYVILSVDSSCSLRNVLLLICHRIITPVSSYKLPHQKFY